MMNLRISLLAIAVLLALAQFAYANPEAKFSQTSIEVTAGATADSPPVVIEDANGVASFELFIALPQGVSIDTSTSGGNLVSVTKGPDTNFFFSEWQPATGSIAVAANVTMGSTLTIINSIKFSTTADFTGGQMVISGTLFDSSGQPISANFGSLNITTALAHTVDITAGPSVNPAEVDSGGTTSATVTAVDSLGQAINYSWSDNGAGGSFAPSANVQNPTYTAPINSSGANRTITLTATATSATEPAVSDTGTVQLTVRSVSNTVTITSGPSVNPAEVDSGGTTNASVTAVESLGQPINYSWSDNGAGGSFGPSANAQNPTYTAPVNKSGANINVTLAVIASSATEPAVNDTKSVQLTVRSVANTVTITSGPSVNPTVVASGGTTAASVMAEDSLGHSVAYSWSDNGAGGSFAPNANTQNPAYTAPANTTGADITITLAVTASDSTDSSVSAQKSVGLTVHPLVVSPTVVSVQPQNGSTDVALNAPIVVQFSKAMNQSATEAAVSISPAVGGLVYSWNAGGTMLTIGHDNFMQTTLHTVTVGTGAIDQNGQQLQSPFVWTFTTSSTQAGLSITKTASSDSVFARDIITYTLTVTNNGPNSADNVVVTDNLPAQTTFVFCSSTGGGECSGTDNNRTITFPTLAAGETETITLIANVNSTNKSTQIISNTATVTSDTFDAITDDNTSTVTTTVVGKPAVGVKMNSLLVSGDPYPVPGTKGTWVFAIIVNGCSTSSNINASGTISAPFSVVDISASAGSAELSPFVPRTIDWHINRVSTGQAAVLLVAASGTIPRNARPSSIIVISPEWYAEYLSGLKGLAGPTNRITLKVTRP